MQTTLSGSTATPAPAPTQSAESAAPAPRPPKRTDCPLCFSKEKHGETPAETCCVVCGNAHGTQVQRQGRGRKVVIRHSLPVVREGGRNADGSWVNRDAPWVADAICDDCGWDLRRRSRGTSQRIRFFDFVANLAEVEARTARDAEWRAQREAEGARRDRVEALFAKGYGLVGGPRGGRGGNRGGQRDGRRSERGSRRDSDEATPEFMARVRGLMAAHGVDMSTAVGIANGQINPHTLERRV